jgi:hypothetical protein
MPWCRGHSRAPFDRSVSSSAIGPVHQVGGVAPGRWNRATGEAAMSAALPQRQGLHRAEQSAAAAEVERGPGAGIQGNGRDLGVATEPACRVGAEQCAYVGADGGSRAGAAGQLVGGHGEDQSGRGRAWPGAPAARRSAVSSARPRLWPFGACAPTQAATLPACEAATSPRVTVSGVSATRAPVAARTISSRTVTARPSASPGNRHACPANARPPRPSFAPRRGARRRSGRPIRRHQTCVRTACPL